MNKIIINADDLGYSLSVNRAIEKAVSVGVISSTTVMASMSDEALADAVSIREMHPEISYGAHLNLTEGKPLLQSDYLLDIGFLKKNEEGVVVFDGLSFRKKYLSRKAREEIFNELDAQVTKLESYGFKPSHIDSHHHIHTELFILPAVVKVAKKHGITKMRIIRNFGVSGMNALYRRLWRFYLRLLYNRVTTTALFGAYNHYVNGKEQNRGNCSVLELMCHPGGKDKYRKEEELLYTDSVFNENEKITYLDL